MNSQQETICDDTEMYFDPNLIPPHQQEALAAATLELYHSFMAQPGAREMIEKKKAELGL